MKMHNLGRTKLRTEAAAVGSNEDFLEKAIDALSVLKISNSYLQSTIEGKSADQKTITAFSMIKKSIVKIEAFLDSAKHEQKVSTKKDHDHSSEKIKKRWFALSELMEMIKPKNIPSTVQINLPKNNFQVLGNFYKLVGLFLTEILPPCNSIIVFTIFNPSPLPSGFVVYNEEKAFLILSSGNPGPESLISIKT